MTNIEPSSRKSDLVRKLDEELGQEAQLRNKIATFPEPPSHKGYGTLTSGTPYMRMDYDGTTLFVSTILENQEKALKLIAAMTAMVPFLPGEPSARLPTEE